MKSSHSPRMASVRQRDTAPEVKLRTALWSSGLRYRKNTRVSGIRVDIVLMSSKVAIFVDGCFWHGCPEHYVAPRQSAGFWAGKLVDNRLRDDRQARILESQGWHVLRIWEHEVNRDLEMCVSKIRAAIQTACGKASPLEEGS